MDLKALKSKYRVGICGHRNLKISGIEQYRKEITSILTDVMKKNSLNEIFLVTSLAEGADTVGVESASSLGLRYEVVLPMDIKLYRNDFSDAGRDVFDKLFIYAAGSSIVSSPFKSELNDISIDGVQRDLQYLKAGQEIVDRSQCMIFLWDGIDNGLVGGTSNIVKYARDKHKSIYIVKCERENEGKNI